MNLKYLTKEEKRELFILLCMELKERGQFDRLLNYAIKLYKDDEYIINDNEPDPLKMSKEEYLKAREEYSKKGIARSKRMREAIEKDKKRKSSKQ
jgi:hypothetical protein